VTSKISQWSSYTSLWADDGTKPAGWHCSRTPKTRRTFGCSSGAKLA
jgi:uncharacterized protein YbdZ (MbtH family)